MNLQRIYLFFEWCCCTCSAEYSVLPPTIHDFWRTLNHQEVYCVIDERAVWQCWRSYLLEQIYDVTSSKWLPIF